MTDYGNRRKTWERYASAWKEPTAEGKAAALRESAIEHCMYTDPLIEARGHQELTEYMLAFHQQVPGGSFETTWFLTHHDVSIAKWDMLDGGGNRIGDGVSYARYDEAGMLVAMTGFFETPA